MSDSENPTYLILHVGFGESDLLNFANVNTDLNHLLSGDAYERSELKI